METCASCGRTIGRLETPHVYGNNIVCPECLTRLTTSGVPAIQRTAPIHETTKEVMKTVESRLATILLVIFLLMVAAGLMKACAGGVQ